MKDIPLLFYQEHTLDNWDAIREVVSSLSPKWIFRGQKESAWPLKSSFERAAEWAGCHSTKLRKIELDLFHQFRRRAHLYYEKVPKESSVLEWLALMQHHGAPTRLIDFTKSFYVALFFAISEVAHRQSGTAAVWALNHSFTNMFTEELMDNLRCNQTEGLEGVDLSSLITPLHSNLEIWENLLGQGYLRDAFTFGGDFCILPVEPHRMNERISAQQGLFVMQDDISVKFEERLTSCAKYLLGKLPGLTLQDGTKMSTADFDLCATLVYRDKEHRSILRESGFVIKFLIPNSLRPEIMDQLESMNINNATLFPGMDGYTRSLMRIFDIYADEPGQRAR